MPITVLCVGKMKERFYADAANEYLKRLKRLIPTHVTELADEPEPTNSSEKIQAIILKKEGERILQKIGLQDYVIALCIDGQMPSSEKLAQKIQTLFTQGKSQITFVIGGSLGLDPSVIRRADERLSMSAMTFPHQLARVMLLEQLFRAGKINAGQRYHK